MSRIRDISNSGYSLMAATDAMGNKAIEASRKLDVMQQQVLNETLGELYHKIQGDLFVSTMGITKQVLQAGRALAKAH